MLYVDEISHQLIDEKVSTSLNVIHICIGVLRTESYRVMYTGVEYIGETWKLQRRMGDILAFSGLTESAIKCFVKVRPLSKLKRS